MALPTTSPPGDAWSNQQIEDDLRLLRDFGSADPAPLVRACVRHWQRGLHTRFTRETIHRAAHQLRAKLANGEVSPFRVPSLAAGPLTWGRLWTPQESASGRDAPMHPQAHLARHVLVVGGTGGGKTGYERFLLDQLLALLKGPRVWIFPNTKYTEFHGLIARHPAFYVLPSDAWPSNILAPPAGCNPENYLVNLADLLARLLGVHDGGALLLEPVLRQQYRDRGVLVGGIPPVLDETFAILRNLAVHPITGERVHPATRSALLVRLGSLLDRMPAAARRFAVGWTPTDLARFSLAFDLRGLGPDLKHLLTHYALTTHFYRQADQGAIEQPLELLACVIDAQRFLMNRTTPGHLSSLDDLVINSRGCGIALLADCQAIDGLSPILVRNMAARIMCRGGTLVSDARLSPTQHAALREHLAPGVCAVALDGADPFLVRYPRVDLPHVTQEDVAARFQLLAAQLPRPIPAPHGDVLAPIVVQARSPADSPAATPVAPLVSAVPNELPPDQLHFLQVVHAHASRGLGASALAELAGLGRGRAKELRDALILAGCLDEAGVQGARGRPRTILHVTAAGRVALGLPPEGPP